jgi:hypothetical protein
VSHSPDENRASIAKDSKKLAQIEAFLAKEQGAAKRCMIPPMHNLPKIDWMEGLPEQREFQDHELPLNKDARYAMSISPASLRDSSGLVRPLRAKNSSPSASQCSLHNSHTNSLDMKQPPELLTFSHAARECAMQMMLNATYIQRELPTLDLPEQINAKIKTMCDSLIDTKHDVMTKLFELADETQTDASKVPGKVQRIVQWLSEPIGEMHQLVIDLQTSTGIDPLLLRVFFLVTESATNILNALNSVSMAADTVLTQE